MYPFEINAGGKYYSACEKHRIMGPASVYHLNCAVGGTAEKKIKKINTEKFHVYIFTKKDGDIIFIGEKAENLLSMLNKAGYKAYVVGGCVRDMLMGKECDDIDITTSATPRQCEEVLKENSVKYIETGLKHGTVTAVIDGETFEITTFRTEGGYADSRHPDSVTFVSDVREDLARRDFTINAIAYNHEEGIVDPYCGEDDIKRKIIRAVGDPYRRFEEDALRIMRGVRFASVLGFTLDEKTKEAALENRENLSRISGERIYSELKKLLLGDFVFEALDEYKEIIGTVIEPLKDTFDCVQYNPWHIYDVYTHIAKSVELAPKDVDLRLVMLLHDIGKPFCKTTDCNMVDHFYGHPEISKELAEKVLKRLKVSRITMERVLLLIELHDRHIHANEPSIGYWLSRIGKERTFDLIDVKTADLASHNLDMTQSEIEELHETKEMLRSMIERGVPQSVNDLAVNGRDIMSAGFSGKEIGDAQEWLLTKVYEGLPNKKDDLLNALKNKR